MSEAALILETASDRVGGGELTFARVAGRTVVTRAEARSPLRLLTPGNVGGSGRAGGAAWAYISSFGGGLLAGDEIAMEVMVEAGAMGYLGSQSSTKVYRSNDGRTSRQTMDVRVEAGAVLALVPEPVVCFADARYEQRQRFEVAKGGGLVLLDWFTSGRHGCGEQWQAERLRTNNEVWIEGKCVLQDVLQLDRGHDGMGRRGLGMGVFNCFATLVMVGEAVVARAGELLAWVNEMPVRVGDMLPMGASALGSSGVVFRMAGVNIEEVGRVLYERLEFLGGEEFLGECPWKRKW